MIDKTLIKLLHVSLGINIKVYDSRLNEITRFVSVNSLRAPYDELNLIRSINYKCLKSEYVILTGMLNEVYLWNNYDENSYLLGPFRLNKLPSDRMFTDLLVENDVSIKYKDVIKNYIEGLRIISLEDIRDIIQLVHYLFTLKLEEIYIKPIYNYANNLKESLIELSLEKLFFIDDEKRRNKQRYETRILKLVRKGSLENLRESVTDLDGGNIATSTGDSFRSEKNYSIIIFEKLFRVAVESGMDDYEAAKIRDQLILDNESAKGFEEIIKVRNGGIVFFTRKVGEILEDDLSPFLTGVLHYMTQNLYKNLSIEDIAKEFNVSKTTLNMIFKSELQTTLKKYFLKLKLDTSKKLLSQNLRVSEISQMLGFADSSHFCKKFKKEMGLTPTQYRRKHRL